MNQPPPVRPRPTGLKLPLWILCGLMTVMLAVQVVSMFVTKTTSSRPVRWENATELADIANLRDRLKSLNENGWQVVAVQRFKAEDRWILFIRRPSSR